MKFKVKHEIKLFITPVESNVYNFFSHKNIHRVLVVFNIQKLKFA